MSRKTLLIVFGLLTVQLGVLTVYFFVESQRDRSAVRLRTEPPRETSGAVTSFEVTSRSGERRDLVGGARPVLVHFWATWCPPCRDELPVLLELDDDHPFDVVAVALDKEWGPIETFLDGQIDPRVVRAGSGEVEDKFDVSSLPQTVLMSRDGELLLRANGARDWSDADFVNHWER